MKTTNFRDCQRFAAAIQSAGGRVAGPLSHLLSSWEVLSSPARSGKPEEAILTAALDGN